MLTHPVNVWHHDPVIRVDEKFHEPAVDVVRVNVTQQHEIPHDHQPFNVVAVAGVENCPDNMVNWRDARCPGIESARHRARMFPVVA